MVHSHKSQMEGAQWGWGHGVGRSLAAQKEEGDAGGKVWVKGQKLPAWVNSLDTLVIDPDMAPQAGGGTEGALTQATGKLFH